MTTRKPIVLISGVLTELDTPTDGISLAGNSTTDLSEGTNLYYTDTRARTSISVVDSGGDGSLTYDNSTGIITYTGPSATDVRSYFSVAVGSGLTYSSVTGEFGTSAIPNTQLANSSITLGSTSISLGGTATSIAGLLSVTSDAIQVGTAGAANSLLLDSTGITFEGSTADAYETVLNAVDPTADQTVSLPNETDVLATQTYSTSLSIALG